MRRPQGQRRSTEATFIFSDLRRWLARFYVHINYQSLELWYVHTAFKRDVNTL